MSASSALKKGRIADGGAPGANPGNRADELFPACGRQGLLGACPEQGNVLCWCRGGTESNDDRHDRINKIISRCLSPPFRYNLL